MDIREGLLAWIDQFENDHYEFDVYGEAVTVNLPRETVEKVMDISILLVNRVVEAQGELSTAEYTELEESVRAGHPDDESWLFHLVIDAVRNDHLFGRYKDIEPMIGELMPRGYPMGSGAYLFTVRPEIHKLIYAVIRHVDDVKDNYKSLVYTFFIGVLTKGWGEGFGWAKTAEGNWMWKNSNSDKGDAKTDENSTGISAAGRQGEAAGRFGI